MVLANLIVLKIEEKDNLGVEDCVKRSSLLLQFCMLPLAIVIANSDQFSSQAKSKSFVNFDQVLPVKPAACICLGSNCCTRLSVSLAIRYNDYLITVITNRCKSQSLTYDHYSKNCIS